MDILFAVIFMMILIVPVSFGLYYTIKANKKQEKEWEEKDKQDAQRESRRNALAEDLI